MTAHNLELQGRADTRTEPPRRRFVDGGECQCGDHIKPGDLVVADFDRTYVHAGGGLYLLVAVKGDRVTWRGARRIERVPDGIAIETPGGTREIVQKLADDLRVVGTVVKVYRPTS